MSLDSASDSTLRRDGATVALVFASDEPTTPPTIAKIVRRHDGGTTVRVRVLGEQATRLVLIRELTSARPATSQETAAAVAAASTSEQAAAATASRSSTAVAAGSGPTSAASTSRAVGVGGDLRTGSFIARIDQPTTSERAGDLTKGSR